MTKLPSPAYSYTFTTESSGDVLNFKSYLNTANVSFTVDTNYTAPTWNNTNHKNDVITTAVAELTSMNNQKLEDVLKTVLKDIKKLKNQIS